MEAAQDSGTLGTDQAPASNAGDGEKVVCFVSKRPVDRSQAKQIRHPKEGLVWVGEEFIK